MTTIHLDAETQKNVDAWLQGGYDDQTKAEIQRLLQENPQAIVDGFYRQLGFGTGGLRGIMGVGPNRMNQYTVRSATQGLANYLKKQFEGDISVFIGYDSRHQSAYFAKEAARVLAGNKIKVFIYEELRPTPNVSFGCRQLHCKAAIMITASHNPPEYNGYKVYWQDGAQILPPHDRGIISEVNAIHDLSEIQLATESDPLIEEVGESLDQIYLDTIHDLQLFPEQNAQFGKDLKIIYSSLHGTGITMVPKALENWGFEEVSLVQEQSEPDGNFPTVNSPNPEERDALSLGIKRLLDNQADLLMATDPDTDRLGVVVRHQGEAQLLNGNQVACLCLYHICQGLQSKGQLKKNAAFVKTIVTTELFRAIAEDFACHCEDVLTGFKYVAEKIRQWEADPQGKHYLFGGEESYGYLLGTDVRDKDAVSSCCLVAEVALQAKRAGKTLVDLMNEIYLRYGVYRERLVSIKFPETREGRAQMDQAMSQLRSEPPKEILNSAVVEMEDYQNSTRYLLGENRTETLHLPKSNVLLFRLADQSKVVIRPSGTEPKVKLYGGVIDTHPSEVLQSIQVCDERSKALLDYVEGLLR